MIEAEIPIESDNKIYYISKFYNSVLEAEKEVSILMVKTHPARIRDLDTNKIWYLEYKISKTPL